MALLSGLAVLFISDTVARPPIYMIGDFDSFYVRVSAMTAI